MRIRLFDNVYVEPTKHKLSSTAGEVGFDYLYRVLKIASRVSAHVPVQKAAVTRNSLSKFRDLVLGFVSGCECLDDMADLAKEESPKAVDIDTYSPKSYGDFLRAFEPLQIKGLNSQLSELAWDMRCYLQKNAADRDRIRDEITFDFDSTLNRQHGIKMEGVKLGYKEFLCLDTFQVFDELGLQYWHDVREGGTYTAEGACEVVHEVVKTLPPKGASGKPLRVYVRADSGFCSYDFMNACAAKSSGFVVRMTANMLDPVVHQVTEWTKTDKSDPERIKFYDGRECEIGSSVFQPKDSKVALRFVVIRAAMKEKGFFADYDHFAWVTNIGEAEKSDEEIIYFYRKRGNAENFIKEAKYGFDLKHYPCQKLIANKAYGMIAAFAFNLMRMTALEIDPETPPFSKKVRRRLLQIPALLVRHAHQVVFRLMEHHVTEVVRWFDRLKTLQVWISRLESV